jgi:hypothetical protein
METCTLAILFGGVVVLANKRSCSDVVDLREASISRKISFD